jgi:hypothetical protein
MKSHGALWPIIVSDENLKRAHKHAKKGKGWYEEVKIVDANVAESDDGMGSMLKDLQSNLINHTHKTSKYTKKQRKEGRKIRDLTNCPITLTESRNGR